MQENELIAQLQVEAFSHTYIWEDVANARYPDHTHRMETAHIILSGEMTLTMQGKSQTYHAGERCDVPADTIHSAIMGPSGCRYIIGER
jgi:mannose-6-phosphate isomerase-like protein (cupin superfamily)